MADESGRRSTFVVTSAYDGARLDTFLAESDLGETRSRIKKIIDEGHCQLNESTGRAAKRVHEGDRVTVYVPPPEPSDLIPEEIPLEVLHEDDHLIVVNKPAGLVVHPGPGNQRGTLVAALLARCDTLSGVGGVLRPGIVHRLDKLTSGVMVATKTDEAHRHLAGQFSDHSVDRRYHALVYGRPEPSSGTFRTSHGRHPVDRKRYTGRREGGRLAITHYRVLETLHRASFVEASLETGRTHQVRVHFAEAGHGLVGDPIYGRCPADKRLRDAARSIGRQALHAYLLGFEHPETGKRLRFETSLPKDMQDLLEGLRGESNEG